MPTGSTAGDLAEGLLPYQPNEPLGVPPIASRTKATDITLAGGHEATHTVPHGPMSGLPEPATDTLRVPQGFTSLAHGPVMDQFLADSIDNSGDADSPQDDTFGIDLDTDDELSRFNNDHSELTSVPRAAGGELCECVPEDHWLRGVGMWTLTLMDWVHVAATILQMLEVTDLANHPDFRKDHSDVSDGLIFRAWLCLAMYLIKVVSHLLMVRVMWYMLGQDGEALKRKYGEYQWKHDETLLKWRHNQQWFIAVTFNSFMMIFVFLYIPTEKSDDYGLLKQFDLVKWTLIKKRSSRANGGESVSTVGRVSTASTVSSVGRNVRVGTVSSVGRGFRGSGVSTRSGTRNVRVWAPMRVKPSRSDADMGRLPSMTSSGATRPKVGLHEVFANTGAGGLGYGPSWVMFTNILCTALAMLINCEALYQFEDKKLSIVSLLAVTFHFVIAFWLYLYSKMAHSQEKSCTKSAAALMIGLVDAANLVLWLLLVYAYTSVGCNEKNHCPSANMTATVEFHTDDHPWRQLSVAWLVCILCGMLAQALLALLQGRQVAKRTLTEEEIQGRLDSDKRPRCDKNRVIVLKELVRDMEIPTPFVPLRSVPANAAGQRLAEVDAHMDKVVQSADEGQKFKKLKVWALKYSARQTKSQSNAFAAVTFNTWLMALALLGLRQPYGSNLLKPDWESPFNRVYKFNPDLIANALIGVVTICRAACTLMCVYVAASVFVDYTDSEEIHWGQLKSVDARTTLFSFKPWFTDYIKWACLMFCVQTGISFFFAFVWSKEDLDKSDKQSTTSALDTAAAMIMLFMCVLDLVVIVATGYYAACILDPMNPLLECEQDFGPWIHAKFDTDAWSADRAFQGVFFELLASAVLILYCGRIILQTIIFAFRRTVSVDVMDAVDESSVHCSDVVPRLTTVYNGIFHGIFLLLAQYPVDLPVLLNGRWSILQTRPHWTNGLLQVIVLIEKTIMGYLVLELANSKPCDDSHNRLCFNSESRAQITRYVVMYTFAVQCVAQFAALVYQQVKRPGRHTREITIHDHIRCEVNSESNPGLNLDLENDSKTYEVLEIRTPKVKDIPRASRYDVDDSPQHDRPQPQFRIEIIRDDGEEPEIVWVNKSEHKVEQVISGSWQMVVVFLAFLDWFHIAFNLTNLINMLGYGWKELYKRDELKADILTALCYLCIGIYSVRVFAQPVLLLWRGAPVAFSKWVFRLMSGLGVLLSLVLFIVGLVLATRQAIWMSAPIILIGTGNMLIVVLGVVTTIHCSTHARLTHGLNALFILSGFVNLSFGVAVAIYTDNGESIADKARKFEDFERVEGLCRGSNQIFADLCAVLSNQTTCVAQTEIECDWTWNADMYDTCTDVARWILLILGVGNILRAVSARLLAALASDDVNSHTKSASAHDATAMWSEDPRWYSAMTFNTFLMLPAMLLVENPYRDTSKTVTHAFVRLGRKGWVDYIAGGVLLMMVIKKTINAYLIVEFWNVTSESLPYMSVVSLALLVLHFVATLYVMMVPKLAHSQKPRFRGLDQQQRRICCCNKATAYGIGLLTIALVDWVSIIINTLSLVNLLYFYRLDQHSEQNSTATESQDLTTMPVTCQHNPTIRVVAIFSMTCYVVRVLSQMLVFVWLHKLNGSLQRPSTRPEADNYRPDYRPTMMLQQLASAEGPIHTTIDSESDRDPDPTFFQDEENDPKVLYKNDPWRKWRDEFQVLSFNSWMMIPALLFIEKPYYANVLRKDYTSPFHRRNGAIGTIFAIMLLKKTGILYVNGWTLWEGCLDAQHNQSGSDEARNSFSKVVSYCAVVMTIIHTAIWFVYSLGGQFICHDEPPNVQRGHGSTAHIHQFDTSSSDEDDDDEDDDDDEPHNTVDDHDKGDHDIVLAEDGDHRTVPADEAATQIDAGPMDQNAVR